MKYIYFLILILCLFFAATQKVLGQINADSLVKSIATMSNDTNKIKQLRLAAQQYEMKDTTKAKSLYFESIALCNKLNHKKEAALSYLTYGVFKINYNQYDTAEYYGKKGMEAATAANSEIDKGKAYNLIGNSFLRRSKYDKANENYLQAAAIFEKLKEQRRLALVLSNVCAVFVEMSDAPNAIKYGEQALKAAELSKDADAIGRSYFNLGGGYSIASNETKCIEYYKKGLPFVKKSGIPSFIQQGYYNVAYNYADIAKKTGNLNAEAALYADSSLDLARQMNNPLNLFYATTVAGRIATYNNQYSQAESFYKEAYENLKKDSSAIVLRTYYTNLSELRYKQGQYKEAYELRIKRDVYNDSILKTEKIEAIGDNEAKYESSKKETEIQLQKTKLRQKTITNTLLIGGLLALGAISFLVYRNLQQKRRADQLHISELEKEKQLTATAAVLQGESQERTRLAKDLHDGLGGMLSGIKYALNNMKENLIMTPDNANAFSRSMDMLDNSIQEMRRVAHNMMPESLLRYGLHKTLQDYIADCNKNGVTFITYEGNGIENVELDNNTSINVYRIIQELINNTLKHAKAKNMLVQIYKTESGLNINVEDDGVGFDTKIIDTVNGIGWKNIKNRVDYLQGTMQVQSEQDNGTQINIEVKA